jgi:hypothetical protein
MDWTSGKTGTSRRQRGHEAATESERRDQNETLCSFTVTQDPDGTRRIVVTGEADLSVADRLRALLAGALAGATGPVLVDCAGLRYLDSSGIRELLRA